MYSNGLFFNNKRWSHLKKTKQNIESVKISANAETIKKHKNESTLVWAARFRFLEANSFCLFPEFDDRIITKDKAVPDLHCDSLCMGM